nr:uncharacterized protein LOC129254164 isoform X2 [Lytechinus pictus]
MVLPKAQVSSDKCASSTLRQRSDTMMRSREITSGGATKQSLAHEVKFRNLSAELDELMAEGSIRIQDGEMLDLKVALGLSWTRHRKLKRWLKQRKVFSEGEKAMRDQMKEIVGDNLTAKWLPFQFHNDELRCTEFLKAPMVMVCSLQRKVFSLLDEYDKLNQLTWTGIPTDEIWLKLGGDKGGKSFKLAIQVANLLHPNSPRNTVMVAVFQASDSTFNLDLALKDFASDVELLMRTTWRGKRIRLFLCGDYEFLTKFYGLTGPNGRHCCLYCSISKAQMAVPLEDRGPSPSRTLETLSTNLQEYKEDKVAKNHNNVIKEPLFKIPIDQVCPPGLHISLGLFYKHYTSMEQKCHELDVKVAEMLSHRDSATVESPGLESLVKLHSLQRKMTDVANEQKDLLEQISCFVTLFPDESQPVRLLQEEASEKEKERKKLEREISKLPKVSQGSGPIASSLDTALQSIRVRRQAFFGKTFNGNHVHKCLMEKNIAIITSAIVDTTEKLCPESSSLNEEAKHIRDSYNKLFSLYGKCHRQFNSIGFMEESDILELDKDIKAYLKFFRENWPKETNPPKLHLLEDHVVPWLRTWNAPLGLMGEQGIESLHSQLNTIQADLRGFSNDLDILINAMKIHWVQTDPHCHAN